MAFAAPLSVGCSSFLAFVVVLGPPPLALRRRAPDARVRLTWRVRPCRLVCVRLVARQAPREV